MISISNEASHFKRSNILNRIQMSFDARRDRVNVVFLS